jgi:hypothetical protein
MGDREARERAWHREHFDAEGRCYVAMATWVQGRWEARIWTKTEGGVEFPSAIGCDSEERAKIRAEELLQDGVPHVCQSTGCQDWRSVVNLA